MAHQFAPGDDLIFQLESAFGLLRVIAIDGDGVDSVWHLLAYDEFFPDIEAAELALAQRQLAVRAPHLALTNRAFERTPAARLGNRPVNESELEAVNAWREGEATVSDRSALLMLGIR